MTKYENNRIIDIIRKNKEWQKWERITVKLWPNIMNINRNLIERIKELNSYTNDITYRGIRSILNKTIYLVHETIDIIRLCYVSIKISYIKKR